MSIKNYLYESMILDHNRNPRNYPKRPTKTNRSARGFNERCNDELFIHLEVKNAVVVDLGFEGAACTVATASASLMTEIIKNKTEKQVEELFRNVREFLLAEGPKTGRLPGKLVVLEEVKQHPARVNCASLPWHTLKAALDQQTGTVSTE